MSMVGAFPGINDWKRRTIRGQINPLDKSTVISVLPKSIHEVKVTIQPGVFDIEAGSEANPAILVVGPSSWWREVDEDQPLLEIPTSSIAIADSIVKDYCNGILGCNMDSAMPGLFYVPGCKQTAEGKVNINETRDWVLKEFKTNYDRAVARQKNWWMTLVKLADSLWARSNGNPLAISDDMRLAAKEMNLQTKDWMKEFQMVDMVRCVACGTLKNPAYPVCTACRAIDPNHPKAKEIKFAV